MPPLFSPLSSEERRAILALARGAILEAIVDDPVPDYRLPSGRLAETRGAFVTLYLRRRLRGCMGRAETSDPLAETVAQTAVNAALHDPRFAPVSREEVSELEIEVSVLSELRPISADAIEAGTHGVVVSRGERRALLLPQVAAERRWSSSRFLAEACRKAGLDPEAWRDPQTLLFGFTVEVVSESRLRPDYSSST